MHVLARKEPITVNGVAQNIAVRKHGQLLSVLACSYHYCNPADGIFDANNLLSCAVNPTSLQKWVGNKKLNEVKIMYQLHYPMIR